ESGDSLEAALDREKAYFPPLFLALGGVGERTGNLPEVFAELEKYYILQQKLWRQFVGQITWPLLQFFAAVFVIAGLLFILGIIAEIHGGSDKDTLLPHGMIGGRGAGLFLGCVFGTLGVLTGGYFLM